MASRKEKFQEFSKRYWCEVCGIKKLDNVVVVPVAFSIGKKHVHIFDWCAVLGIRRFDL